MRLIGRRGTAVAGLVGLCLGLLALGPGIGPGYLLSYDMVFVPKPPFSATMFGLTGTLPRAVPSDAVVAFLAHLLPADLVQKLLLLLIFALACAGAAALLATEPLVARLAAGVCFAWNPYIAERLILGQWALLLGYAGLPWVALAMTRPAAAAWHRAGHLALALLPAAVGGFAAMCVSGLVVVPAAALAAGQSARRRVEGLAIGCAVIGLLSLPWLIPSLARAVHTSAAGVDAFAPRADTPFGSLGSLLMLSGTWNSQTVPAGYGGPASGLWLALVVLALASFAGLARARWPGLGVGAVAGLLVASLGITGPGRNLLGHMISAWPGFAVLRDGQQFVAPLALVEALGLGVAVAWVLRRQWHGSAYQARWIVVAAAVVAPMVLLPGLAWGGAGRLHSVEYPADWLAARRLIDADPVGGRVLVLPWGAYRRLAWNGYEAVLDPWPRLLDRSVIWNDAVRVGSITVPPEDPLARALTPAIESGAPLTQALEAAGVRYVIVDAGFSPAGAGSVMHGAYPDRGRLPAARVVLAGPGLVVYLLPRQGAPPA